MSNNGKKRKKGMSRKTKTSITVAVFILAILVIILCIMSGSLHFTPGSTGKTETTPTPEVTAPPAATPEVETPEPTQTPEPASYSVTVFAGHGGSADPTGTTMLREGEDITVVFTPDAGYHVNTLTVNGELVDPADSYTITDISDNMTIDVSFDTAQQTDTPAYTAAP